MAYPTNGSAHNKTQRAREDEHEGENLYFSINPRGLTNLMISL